MFKENYPWERWKNPPAAFSTLCRPHVIDIAKIFNYSMVPYRPKMLNISFSKRNNSRGAISFVDELMKGEAYHDSHHNTEH